MKISVGIPFYNSQKFLGQAITSVLNQDFKDFELILLDDGSTDASLNIARSFNDERIRIISDGKNKGLSVRLNELTHLAKGEFYVRMDADDIMFSNRLSTQLRYLENHKDVDVVGSWAVTIDIKNNIVGQITSAEKPNRVIDVLHHRCFIHPSIMAKRQWFEQNPYDDSVVRMEDFNLWMRTIDKYKFYNIQAPLMFYRISGLSYLDKYLLSMKGERNEYKKYKNIMPNYNVALLKNYLKCAIYYVFYKLHIVGILLKKRSKNITDNNYLTNINRELNSSLGKLIIK